MCDLKAKSLKKEQVDGYLLWTNEIIFFFLLFSPTPVVKIFKMSGRPGRRN